MIDFVQKLQTAREVQRFIENRAMDKSTAMYGLRDVDIQGLNVEDDYSAIVTIREKYVSGVDQEDWAIVLSLDELTMDHSVWVDHCQKLRKATDDAKYKKQQARLEAVRQSELAQLRRLQEKFKTDIQPIDDKLDSMIEAG